ncbi:MAG: cell division FtsZ family protein [Opitutaceae bacterium]|nr:cell division FtsZ family protein [Opitutaceae bacterium]
MNHNELSLEPRVLADRAVAIKLVGVGGAGSNAVDRLKMENLARLQLAVINTDFQALSSSPVQEKVLIGLGITRGLGAGGDPDLGRQAAEADREKIAKVVKDCDLIFLVTGEGGGTGSGAAPVVAEIAAESGALVMAFVTMPFSFEGGRRLKQAEEGLKALRAVCDAVIPLPNDVLLQEASEGETVLDSFARADAWIGRGVKSIWAMLSKTGLINVDFATLRQTIGARGGKTLFGLAEGSGDNAMADAVAGLKVCPLLHTPEFSRKADRLLVNIIGGAGLTMHKVNELMTAVTEQFGRDSHIQMGAVIDEEMGTRVEVCILGTSDMGRGGNIRRPVAPPKSRPLPAADPAGASPAVTSVTVVPASPPSTPPTRGEAKILNVAPPAQEEFGFGEVESRGTFEKTDRILHDGHDLDVPTYLRKGIKIHI